MSLELEIDKWMNKYFEEEPIIVPTLYEFAEWLYDTLFWEDVAKRDEGNKKKMKGKNNG